MVVLDGGAGWWRWVMVVEMGGGGDGWWRLVVVVEMGVGGGGDGWWWVWVGVGEVSATYPAASINFELTDKITPEYITLYILTLIVRHPSRNIVVVTDYST